MILVTGATGTVGSLVVERLLAQGVRPCAFVRDAAKARARFGDGVDIAIGDLTDATSLANACRGAERILLINAGPELASRDALAAATASAAGVAHIVKLSTADAEHGVGTGPWHARGEEAIRDSGVGFTFVRPAGFMDNVLAWVPAVKAGAAVRSSTGEGRIPFIHSRDIADVVAAALTSPEHDGATLTITGPVALSYGQMATMLGEALGRAIPFLPISEEEDRARWTSWGETQESVDYHMSIFRAIREGRLAEVTATVPRVLGRPATSFDEWVREHVVAFR
ncbi:MAG TPA: SDR family oxidoreductase [Polyangiaceae bacterium]|nr:SDR family oxidoreductase [Polyangiaceae bacterium]